MTNVKAMPKSADGYTCIMGQLADLRAAIESHGLAEFSAPQALSISKELLHIKKHIAYIVMQSEQEAQMNNDEAQLYHLVDGDGMVVATDLFYTKEAAEISLSLEAEYRQVGDYKITAFDDALEFHHSPSQANVGDVDALDLSALLSVVSHAQDLN